MKIHIYYFIADEIVWNLKIYILYNCKVFITYENVRIIIILDPCPHGTHYSSNSNSCRHESRRTSLILHLDVRCSAHWCKCTSVSAAAALARQIIFTALKKYLVSTGAPRSSCCWTGRWCACWCSAWRRRGGRRGGRRCPCPRTGCGWSGTCPARSHCRHILLKIRAQTNHRRSFHNYGEFYRLQI